MNRFALILLVLACASGAIAQTMPATSVALFPTLRTRAVPTTQPLIPPPYTLNRWDEDYAYLKDPGEKQNLLDSLKYIPLDKPGNIYLTLGGQVRERYEHLDHENLYAPPPPHGGGYQLQRILPYADLHIGPDLRVFIEGRFAFEEDRDPPRPFDVDQADLEQAFVDLKLPFDGRDSSTTRVGRQDLLFGQQRLIGPADWNDARRNFDGFRETLNTPNNQLDIFLVRPVQIEKYMFDSDDSHTVFGGIYDSLSMPWLFQNAHSKFEPYVLYLDRAYTSYPAVKGLGDDKRFTIGSHFTTHPGDFDFDVEADYQCGDFKNENIEAYSVATVDGYKFSTLPLAPHAFIGYDIASGDSNKTNNTLGTYNQLFPSGHYFFGYINVLGRQNVIDLHPGIDFTLLKDVQFAQYVNLEADYHILDRQTIHDAAYTVSGAMLRNGSTAKHIGNELDLLLNWQINRDLLTYVGYSHFFAGEFLHDTGAAHDIDFFYAAVQFTF